MRERGRAPSLNRTGLWASLCLGRTKSVWGCPESSSTSCAGCPAPRLASLSSPVHGARCSTVKTCDGKHHQINSTPIIRPHPMMPTIASSSSPPQRPPPGDADLQDLYDQVLSAFAEESSPSSFSPAYSINRPNNVDHDPPYSPHSDEGLGSHISSRHHPQSRGRFSFSISTFASLIYLFPAPTSPRDNNRPLPSPTAFPTSPTLGKGPRPLPRLPGASPTAYPSHMPEPHPFQDHHLSASSSSGAMPSPEQYVTPSMLVPPFLSHSMQTSETVCT